VVLYNSSSVYGYMSGSVYGYMSGSVYGFIVVLYTDI